MKRFIVIALAIVCGMAYSEGFAQTSSAISLYNEIMKLEEQRAELEKEDPSRVLPVMYLEKFPIM